MKQQRLKWYLGILLICVLLTGCSSSPFGEFSSVQGKLKVVYLDVGQADCTIITDGKESMLIDAGNNNDDEQILSYLDQMGITELDYAIGTHSHEDHIGSMDSIINHIEVENIIMPEESSQTKTYRDVLKAIEQKNVNWIRPAVGETYQIGDASFQILAPNRDSYPDPNEYSVGILLTYGTTRFLFTGDASEQCEKEMIENGLRLKVDVLQAGHHGSSTSNSQEFLKKVDPIYCVISCGVNNQYGHPHVETLARLEDSDVQIYRTDLQGTIEIISDGKNLSFSVEKSIALSDKKEKTYILNRNSKKFHLPECSSVESMEKENREEYQGLRKELIEQGYEPCKRCNP